MEESHKIFFHFLKTSGDSLKIILGLRGNEQYLRLIIRSGKGEAIANVLRVSKQFPKIPIKMPQAPKPIEVFERSSVLIRGVKEFAKLASNQATSSKPKSNEPDTNINWSSTGAPKSGGKLDSFKLPKDKRSNIKLPEKQELSGKSRESRVPASRIARFASFGGLAASLGIGALKQVASTALGGGRKDGKTNSINDMKNIFLSEENAQKIVDTLCRTRGAGLKIGQMLSLQDNTMISPQLQAIFERVRQSADFMPYKQMEKVLTKELGETWRDKLESLDIKPFAAASIGQVHRVILKDGREAAMKIQYPGVAESIDSDIKNLVSILGIWNILPDGLFIDTIVKVGRKELMWEVDYVREAECARRFRQLMEPYFEEEGFYVPKVIDELCTKRVFTSELIKGIAVDKLESMEGITQEVRDSVARRLLWLCLREVFVFRFMQTDPNWSNFFYDPTNDVINLLDFGATREFEAEFVDKYLKVIYSAAKQDRKGVLVASKELGFLTGYESKIMENAHIDAVMILGEAFAYDGLYDFGNQNTTKRINDLIPVMLSHRLTPPPEETYSLHRKTAGVFLLCTRLKSKINCKELFDDTYKKYLELKSERSPISHGQP